MSDALAPAPRGPAAAIAAAALLLVAIVGGYALYGRPATPTPRPVSGDALLDEAVSVGPAGISRRFRVKVPCTVEFRIDPETGSSANVSFGVPQPVEVSPADVPAAATAVAWTVTKGDAPRREVVLAPGLYVLRIEAPPPWMLPVLISLRALPPR